MYNDLTITISAKKNLSFFPVLALSFTGFFYFIAIRDIILSPGFLLFLFLKQQKTIKMNTIKFYNNNKKRV